LPIAGVKVYLLDATTGAKLDSTITDGGGKYLFDSLVAGNYKVQFVVPIGSQLVSKNTGTDVNIDSNPDPTTGITDIITVDTTKPIGDPARDIKTVDAGIKPTKVDVSLKKSIVGNCRQTVGQTVIFKIVVKREDTNTTNVNVSVRDSLSSYLQFVSATTTNGSYNSSTGTWSGINLAKGDSAILTVSATIKLGTIGLVCNDAWVSFMDKEDFDSIAGNKIETEDDFGRACVSVPVPLCMVKAEKVELNAPTGYTTYQWYKNGQLIQGATNATYLATTIGEYSVTVNGGSCPANACCPIYVEDVCDCPPTICVPYVIQKTKSKK
jgi:uncharacterized repeat protein (TIGR01451 family)